MALTTLFPNEQVVINDKIITIKEKVVQGHKFALQDLKQEEMVIKYGAPIGHVTCNIKEGMWVHTHNMKTNLSIDTEYEYNRVSCELPIEHEESLSKITHFKGYVREDGRVGIRNDIFILPTVGCVNKIATKLEGIGNEMLEARRNELNKDNQDIRVLAFPHPYGCSQMGDDQENTREILAALAKHPNAGGVLVLGLGCENSNVEEIKKYIKHVNDKRVKFLVCQEAEDEIEEARKLLLQLIQYTDGFKREEAPISELVIGLKCGGSDGLSGITANPTVGLFSDYLISKGGTTILTEVPEMFGAETMLMNRCENRETFEKTVNMIKSFKEYYTSHNQVIYENPSPGNKAGGISTLEDKSLGCTQKSGTARVVDVLPYGKTVERKGLNLLSAPGNDLIAATALAASGAQLILFTTGRGTPFASPVPTMKISTNSELAKFKSGWIDFDCGEIVRNRTIKELAVHLFEEVILIASGKKVKSELSGYHDMAIFKTGVTL